MKLALNMQSVDALRKLAVEIPCTMENIINSTEHLLFVYDSVSASLGVHEFDFHNMVLSIRRAQELSVEAIEAIPKLLITTADKIEYYVNLHPICQNSDIMDTSFRMHTVNHASSRAEESIIRQRTIFEIAALRDSLELTEGDSSIVQIGGRYNEVDRELRIRANRALYEIHHIPPQSVFSDNSRLLPTIAMLKQDHAKTTSYRGKMKSTYQSYFPYEESSQKYKLKVENLLKQGLLFEAIRNEILEIKSVFGSKYDGAIKMYLNAMIQYIDEKGVPMVLSEEISIETSVIK